MCPRRTGPRPLLGDPSERKQSVSSSSFREMHVALLEKQLWKEFDDQCNEMIITKIGRNLFPILEYAFKDLHEHIDYQIGVTMAPLSCHKLKFTAGRWDQLDVLEEVLQPNEVFMSKARSGRELMTRGLKLDKLKLTNTKDALMKSDQMIRVQSMRQYIPVLNIYQMHANGSCQLVGKFQFPETKFIAVTAYQSDQVKHLKVQKNKFAQGFRESARPTKRPTSTTSSNSDSTLDSTASENSDLMLAKRQKTSDDFVPFHAFENIAPVNHFQFEPQWTNYYPTYDYSNPYFWTQ